MSALFVSVPVETCAVNRPKTKLLSHTTERTREDSTWSWRHSDLRLNALPVEILRLGQGLKSGAANGVIDFQTPCLQSV